MHRIVKNTVFYMAGLFIYLFSQWIMSILVVRLSGSYEEAGVFGTALSVTNVFFIISSFSLRNYQVSDINEKFSDSEYVTFRVITCGISILVLLFYLLIMQYSLYTSLSVLCYMLIKIAESVVDVIHGIFQKNWRLDLACKSYTIRGIANLVVFSATEYAFKNLVLSLLLTAVVSLMCTLVIDIRYCRSMFDITISFKNQRLIKLLRCGLPLFIHGLLSTLIYNIPRIIAQKVCGEELFGYYASVAAPTVIIQLAVSSVFSPCITVMSAQYQKQDKKLFKTIAGIQGLIIAMGLIAAAGFSLLGNWFLESMFGKEILLYTDLLIPAVIAAVLISVMAFISSIFTVIDHNVIMAILEGATFVINLILSFVFIGKYGLQGINFVLIISCILFTAVGYCVVVPLILKKMGSFRKNNERG